MISSFNRRTSVLAIALMLTSCGSGGSSGEQEEPMPSSPVLITEIEKEVADLAIVQPALEWSACVQHEGIECATLLVPMDYANIEGQTIEVEMARVARADRSLIRRTLLINPGGPGGSGVNFLASFSTRSLNSSFSPISDVMRDQVDFISFDPRGIGLSTPIECDLTPLFQQDLYTISREEIASNVSLSTEFANACFEDTGEYLQLLGSNQVVLDINEMRKALGLAQIDFLGYSYGSRLAALYLQNFPDKAGRFVLDGSMPPRSSVAALVGGGLKPGQTNIDNLISACIGTPDVCVPTEFEQALQQRVNELGALPNSSESSLLSSVILLAMTRPGFEQLLIGRLAAYLSNDFDVSELEVLDTILGLSEAGEDVNAVNDAANIAVLCGDDAQRLTVDELVSLSEQFNQDSDLLAEGFVSAVGNCSAWPEALNPVADIATNQAPSALVIGGPTDAQTPLIFAEQMAQAVGGQFLRSNHRGHTTVFTGENACTDAAVDTFFLSGELPSVSTCEAGSAAIVSDWHHDFMR